MELMLPQQGMISKKSKPNDDPRKAITAPANMYRKKIAPRR